MAHLLKGLWIEECGQDMVEYSLLITFIGIACMWFLGYGNSAVKGIWTSTNTTLSTASQASGSGG